MNFRSTKIARTQRGVQSSDCESRGKLRELTFMDKEARIYFPRSSYAQRTYICVACHVYTHTQTCNTRTCQFIAKAISRFTVASPRVVSCPYRDVYVCDAVFSPPRGSLKVHHIFFSFGTAFRRTVHFGYVRRRRPWSHAAIGRA